MSLVYIIEDDQIMADCLALAIGNLTDTAPEGKETSPEVMIFNDAVSAIDAIDSDVPDVILLDILLSGPDGFTFLNELISYYDTARIPVALMSSLNLENRDLEHYGVFRILNKGTMTPLDIQNAVRDGIAMKREREAAEAEAIPELVPDQPIASQIEQFSSQAVTNLRNALEATAVEAEIEDSASSSKEDSVTSDNLVAPAIPDTTSPDDLSPEALAIINGDVSTVMDTAFGMPPTNIEADTEPTTLSETEIFENPAEPIDYLEIPNDDDSF